MAGDTKNQPGEPTIASLAAQLAEQQKHSEKQAKHIKDLTAFAFKTTKEDPAKPAELPKIPERALTFGEKKYRFTVATFRLPGSPAILTAETACTDDEIVNAILEIDGQGILVELV